MFNSWLLTWTTYGTWLPGDKRGSITTVVDDRGIRRRNNQVGAPRDGYMPGLYASARARMKGSSVMLTEEQADVVARQLTETSVYRGWTSLATAVMRNHVHVVATSDAAPEVMLRDYKSYASRALNGRWPKPTAGTWWTESGSQRLLRGESNLVRAIEYVRNQQYSLTVQLQDFLLDTSPD